MSILLSFQDLEQRIQPIRMNHKGTNLTHHINIATVAFQEAIVDPPACRSCGASIGVDNNLQYFLYPCNSEAVISYVASMEQTVSIYLNCPFIHWRFLALELSFPKLYRALLCYPESPLLIPPIGHLFCNAKDAKTAIQASSNKVVAQRPKLKARNLSGVVCKDGQFLPCLDLEQAVNQIKSKNKEKGHELVNVGKK